MDTLTPPPAGKADADHGQRLRAVVTVVVQANQIRAMRAAGEKPTHIARRLGVARSSVYRMLEGVDTSGGLSAAAGAAG